MRASPILARAALVSPALAACGGESDGGSELDRALLTADDLGSNWAESPSQDVPPRSGGWCEPGEGILPGRTGVAFVAWENENEPIAIVGNRVERWEAASMPPLDTHGLPCTFVEQGATVRQSLQPGLGLGDASIVTLMEALDGPTRARDSFGKPSWRSMTSSSSSR